MQNEQYYGGPEEGGWYGTDRTLVRYAQFPTLEQADNAAEEMRVLAKQLSIDAAREFNEGCSRSLDACDARGDDYDTLPEVSGPDSFYVCVTDELPDLYQPGIRHYE